MSESNWRERHGKDRALNQQDVEILGYFTARRNEGTPAKRIGDGRRLTLAQVKDTERQPNGRAIIEVRSQVNEKVLLRQYNRAAKRMRDYIAAQPKVNGRPIPMPLSFVLENEPKRGRPKKVRD